jgi:hypothetical protein
MRYGTPEEARSRLAESARRMAGLRQAPPFRVLAAAGPVPEPARLAECHWCDEVWQRITLLHGTRESAAVWVTSAVHDAEPMSPAEALALERDGYPRLGEEPPAAGSPDSSGQPLSGHGARADLVVDGAVLSAEVLVEGTWWAARVPLDTVTVTVVGHRVPFAGVRLVSVPDLGPWVDGREAELARRRG